MRLADYVYERKCSFDLPTAAVLAGKQEANACELLRHLAYDASVLTRRQRVDRLRNRHIRVLEFLEPKACAITDDVLDKYASGGELQITQPEVLKVGPISDYSNVNEIIDKFNRVDQLRNEGKQLQSVVYAAKVKSKVNNI